MSDQRNSSDHARVGGFPEPVKRIALVYWASEGDGVASHLASYARNLAKRGHEVTWFMGTRDTKVAIPQVKMVYSELLDLDAPAPQSDDVRRWFERHATNADFDVVHLHNAHFFRPEVAEGLIQLPLALVHTYHSPFSGIEAERTAPVVNPIPGLAVSDWMRNWAAEKGASVRTSRLGVDLARFAGVPDVQIAADEPVVFGVAGRMVPNKGILEAYQAYAKVLGGWDENSQGTRPKLLIASPAKSVGMGYEKADGYRDELRAKIERAGHADLVRFVNASNDGMPSVYSQAARWISPTIDEEALGLVPMEAQASGRSVTVSNVGGLPETVEQGSGGIVPIPSSDDVKKPKDVFVDSLAAHMMALASNRKGLEEEGVKAREFARRELGEDRQVDDVLGYYDTVTNAATLAQYDKNRPRSLDEQLMDAKATFLDGAVRALQQKYRNHRETRADLRSFRADPGLAELRSHLRKAQTYGRLINESVTGAAKSAKKGREGDKVKHRFLEEGAREDSRESLRAASRLRRELQARHPNASLRRETRIGGRLAKEQWKVMGN